MTGKELKDLISQIPDDAEVQVSDAFGDPHHRAELFEPKGFIEEYDFWFLSGGAKDR